jgi:membrane-bound inhibitor of C-type lysozyme
MHKHPLLFAAAASAALLALPACQQSEPERLNNYDPQGDALKNAAPVALPPAITDNRTYRCSDNSLYYVEFYNNNTALIRTSREGTPVQLSQTGGAGPYSGGNYTVGGNATHTTINGKSCHT